MQFCLGNFDYSPCAQYFKKLLNSIHSEPNEMIHNHIMVLYFVVHGLHVLNRGDLIDNAKVRDYVLSLQCSDGGFRPSSFYSIYSSRNKYDIPHIVFTYLALNILHYVGGIQQVDKEKCLNSVLRCRKENGSFSTFHNTDEADLRGVYSALCICKHFEDFSIIDRGATVAYINQCYNFDGGYGLSPYGQSHAGAIYCAIASLKLLNQDGMNIERTINFLVNRQAINEKNQDIIGIQGRIGKLPDSCYAFWVGASIYMLTGETLLNQKVAGFLRLCFQGFNFSKYPLLTGDPLHTLHSIVGLKILRKQLGNICVIRNIKL